VQGIALGEIKSFATMITGLLPIFMFGHEINQPLAWALIGTAYNLEGHSSHSPFFISSDFHDLRHTNFNDNHKIQGLWDKAFNSLHVPNHQKRIIFPAAYLNLNP
jgi:sterol desaturase/sphingolipid hydroxylase (fatty acid hydroxylase superfamily)